MQTKTLTIGQHTVVLKEELQRKDLVLLAKLKKMRGDEMNDEEFKNELENNMERLFEFTNILVQIFVVSIDGKTEKVEILEIFDNMSLDDANKLTIEVTAGMQNFEKKSETSSMNMNASSEKNDENSPTNG